MKGSYIFLAPGFEETEALATLDVLRRGGMEVSSVSVSEERQVRGSHGISVIADLVRSEFLSGDSGDKVTAEDVMVFPGGMPGTKNLASDGELMEMMSKHYNNGGTVAAICAAPGLVASQLDGLKGKKFTCFDGFQEYMHAKGAVYVKAPAVKDERLITGRGAGCAIEFGLAILSHVKGEQAAESVRHSLML